MNKLEKIEQKLKELDTFGNYAIRYNSPKKLLKKSRVTKEPTPQVKLWSEKSMTVSLTKRDYEDFKLHNERVSEGTYCHPISDNLLVWQHNKNPQKYLRFYKGKNTKFFKTKATYYLDNTEISKREFVGIMKEYGEKKSSGKDDVFNLSLENLLELRHGKVIIKK